MPDYVYKMRSLNKHIQGFLNLEKKEWEIDDHLKDFATRGTLQFEAIATLLPGTRFEPLSLQLEGLLRGLAVLDQERQAVNCRDANIEIAMDLLVKGISLSYHRFKEGASLRDSEFDNLEKLSDWLGWESVVNSYQTGHLVAIFTVAMDLDAAFLMIKRLFEINPQQGPLFDKSLASLKEAEPGLFRT